MVAICVSSCGSMLVCQPASLACQRERPNMSTLHGYFRRVAATGLTTGGPVSHHPGIPAAFNGEAVPRVNQDQLAPTQLAGVLTPVITPLNDDRQLDIDSLERHVGHLLDAGVQGLWVNGTTGEFYGLDVEQRARVVGECVRIADLRVPVIAHVGDTSLALALEQARAARKAGATMVSVLPPYAAQFSQDEIKTHFRALAAEAGPVIAYHMPQIAGPGLTIASIVELAADGVICGAKDSSSDVLWLRQLINAAADAGVEIPAFTGGSAVSDLGYFVGAVGAMSSTANLVPRHLVAQYEAARRGDWDETRARQRQTDELMAALRLPGRTSPTAIAGIYKFLLAALGRIDGARGVAPLRDLTEDEQERLVVGVIGLIEKLDDVQPSPASV
ncbi:dihydrodipicolinate synthase family protein [Microlunatus elymi]|uniref:Dihydrodipicolinate synthase family protein n=1 Tax=Microlunatus elymi TaxID=2596828 RepID=A0A516Q136_9ACTN|nr:dihydrodipicolinate synthase family protein [Microlunatus elymi]